MHRKNIFPKINSKNYKFSGFFPARIPVPAMPEPESKFFVSVPLTPYLVALIQMLTQIFLEIAWQNWHFKIGLSLFDLKQPLLDNGNIVQCSYILLSSQPHNPYSDLLRCFTPCEWWLNGFFLFKELHLPCDALLYCAFQLNIKLFYL